MFRRFTTLFATFVFLLIGIFCLPIQWTEAKQKDEQSANSGTFAPKVIKSLKNDTSIPLRDMKAKPFVKTSEGKSIPNKVLPKALMGAARSPRSSDPVVDNAPVPCNIPPAFQNFESQPNNCGCLPPDTNGDVGPNHYVQTVNVHYQVFDKSGNSLLGPTPFNTLFSGFGGACEDQNDGDPIVLYDHLADRWLVSQFALFAADGGHHQCVAISQTGDPTGAWHRYDFLYSNTLVNDYPHFGVWPDGYYMTANQFTESFSFAGQGVMAFERDEMLNGNPADQIYFDLFPVNPNFGGALPSDLDGPAPPVGSPNIYMEVDDESVFGTDRLSVWEFHVDFTTPGNSTFGIGGNPNLTLDTAPFIWGLCGFSRSCIGQPGTTQGLDSISDRLMHRIQYRNFGSHQSLVTNHTVDADGTDHAGVRWYELRNPGTGWTIFQQGTYAPDAENRWMGSVAMDSAGNIGLGYSVSSETVFPSIRVAGRLASDPPGEMSQGEMEIITGNGNQTFFDGRWGDYSGMVVDPSSGSAGGIDCDFWYTQEHIQVSGVANWQTRVAAFTFAPGACGGPAGTLNGTVTDSVTTLPIEDATVEAGGFTTTTDVNGFYQFVLAAGTYDVTASANGYIPQTVTGVVVIDGGTTTQDFALVPAAVVTVQGIVYDNSGHGWPLYARIDITGFPGGPIFTNPSTGTYDVDLFEGQSYTFNVSAVSAGYNTETRVVVPPAGGSQEDFGLTIDSAACIAPGYQPGQTFTNVWRKQGGSYPGPAHEIVDISSIAAGQSEVQVRFHYYDADFEFWWQVDNVTLPGLSEPFEDGTTPLGWTVLNNGVDADMVWRFDDPCGRGNLTGGTGGFAIADSDCLGFIGDPEDTELLTPLLDMSSEPSVLLEFDTDFFWFSAGMDEIIDVDVGIGIPGSCNVIPGGLIVGNVYDQSTDIGINGATVTSDNAPSDTTTTFSTPEDAKLDEGFYILFSSLIGFNPFTASADQYGSDTHSVNVIEDAVIVQNFALGAGQLVVDPTFLEETVELGETLDVILNLTNIGTAPATFEIFEKEGLPLAGPIRATIKGVPTKVPAAKSEKRGSTASRQGGAGNAMASATAAQRSDATSAGGTREEKDARKQKKRAKQIANAPTAKDSPRRAAPIAEPSAAGDVIQSWPTGLVFAWGVAYDGNDATVWVDSPAAGWGGDNTFYEFTEAGSQTGRSHTHTWGPSFGPADATYNWNTGMLWQMDVGGDDCIHEVDPASGVTGNTICPPWAISQRGVAYDPGTDTWFGGGWNEFIIYRFDNSGAILEQVDVGLSISGLAFNPETQHLFVMVNSSPNNVYVLDATNNYSLVSQFSISGFGDFSGAGLEIACDGSLWAINQSTNTAYQVDSGETASLCTQDVLWLSENPTSGTVAPGATVPITVTFDAGQVNQPGDYFATLQIKEDTPYPEILVPVTMHVPLPATWGTLNGTVEGLGRCDVPGSPLEGATVFVDGPLEDFTLTTDANGFYTWSFDAANSPVDITVSAAGYVGQNRTGVVITAQQVTTENFSLRLDAPCADKSPQSFDVTLNVGQTTTLPLTIFNNGAGELTFIINETVFQLPPQRPASSRKIDGLHKKIGKAASGPSSIRAMRTRGGKKSNVPVPPNVWFFGLDVPGGIVRYAHAQCDLDTNSFYVISGVDGNFSTTTNAWRFDALTDSWNALAPIPTASEGPTGVCYQGKIYVMGGGGTNQHYIYDIASDSWSNGAALPRGVAVGMAGAWSGKVYLIGGDDDFDPSSGVSAEVNVYDIPTDTWTGNGTDMPVPAANSGYVQAGPYVYIVGGWDVSSPATNVNASQRYDMSTDTWTVGPTKNAARADLALAITDTALYALGGDGDGGGFFDSSNTVERLEHATWPAGTWTDPGDPLPIAVTANQAGFCTQAIVAGSEIWSTGGLDTNFSITGTHQFRPSNTEHCFTIFSDVPWLSEFPTSGTVAADSFQIVDVTFDATSLTVGDYFATLVITTNDPGAPQFNIPVALHVTADCPSPVVVAPATLPNGSVGSPYSQTITASGGTPPYTFSVSAGTLPAGLSLDPVTGVISGTPTTEETANFTITATDSGGCSGSQAYTVTIGTSLYFDDFGNQTLNPLWTYVQTHEETADGFLRALSNKKSEAIASDFGAPINAGGGGCTNCTLTTAFRTDAAPDGWRVFVWFHYVDGDSKIELLIRANKIVIREWVDGEVMDKANTPFTVVPNQLHQVSIGYDGTQYNVSVDSTTLTFVPSGTVTGGTFGLGGRKAPPEWDFVQVD